MIVTQMRDGFDHKMAYFGCNKTKEKGLAESLGLKAEELASIIKRGGCDNSNFRISVSHAEAVMTNHDNPFM